MVVWIVRVRSYRQMIYHIKYHNGYERTIRADGFDVCWKSVFAFFTAPEGHASKRTILYAPTSLVLWIEPVNDEVDKELIRAELMATLEMHGETEEL
jgi:hypothetical protein